MLARFLFTFFLSSFFLLFLILFLIIIIHSVKSYPIRRQHFSFGGFPGGSAGKGSACNVETWVQSPGSEGPWRREWLPTPVFWPREFHGLYSPWGCKSRT